MPKLIGQIAHNFGVVAGGHLFIGRHVGNVGQFIVLKPVGTIFDFAKTQLKRPHGFCKFNLLVLSDVLCWTDQNCVLVHSLSNVFCEVWRDLAQIKACNAPRKWRKLLYVHNAFTYCNPRPVSVEFDVGTFDKLGPTLNVLFDGGIKLIWCYGVGFES